MSTSKFCLIANCTFVLFRICWISLFDCTVTPFVSWFIWRIRESLLLLPFAIAIKSFNFYQPREKSISAILMLGAKTKPSLIISLGRKISRNGACWDQANQGETMPWFLLSGSQTGRKLQCLYGNLMANNFRKTFIVKVK